MIGGEFVSKLVDTLHRLADSRKAVGMWLAAMAGMVVEVIPYVVQWSQVLGIDPDRQKRLELTCHAIAATLVFLARMLSKDISEEDKAIKTALPPPPQVIQMPAPPAQTNTVNVATGAAPVKEAAARKMDSNLG